MLSVVKGHGAARPVRVNARGADGRNSRCGRELRAPGQARGDIPQQDSAICAFNKLARTLAVEVETLKRYRSEGGQTVRVEHVTVSDGGQAIVGNVTNGRIFGENGTIPMKQEYSFQKAPRYSAASKRTKKQCKAPAVRGWTVCPSTVREAERRRGGRRLVQAWPSCPRSESGAPLGFRPPPAITEGNCRQGVAVAILHHEEGGWQPENVCSVRDFRI
jgi:hypothetical protein